MSRLPWQLARFSVKKLKRSELKLLDKKKEHLPIYGPGPAFGGSVILMTLTAFFLRKAPFLSAGLVDGIGQKLFIVAGILCVLFWDWIMGICSTDFEDR